MNTTAAQPLLRTTKACRSEPTWARPKTGERPMFDLALIALGVAGFAILILYTAACERM
jgi:hypothetical protein